MKGDADADVDVDNLSNDALGEKKDGGRSNLWKAAGLPRVG